jgi:hypothetical protein
VTAWLEPILDGPIREALPPHAATPETLAWIRSILRMAAMEWIYDDLVSVRLCRDVAEWFFQGCFPCGWVGDIPDHFPEFCRIVLFDCHDHVDIAAVDAAPSVNRRIEIHLPEGTKHATLLRRLVGRLRLNVHSTDPQTGLLRTASVDDAMGFLRIQYEWGPQIKRPNLPTPEDYNIFERCEAQLSIQYREAHWIWPCYDSISRLYQDTANNILVVNYDGQVRRLSQILAKLKTNPDWDWEAL